MWTSASTNARPVIGLSAGEPAGIGPDLCLLLAHHDYPAHLVVAADRDMMRARARQLGLAADFAEYDPAHPVEAPPGRMSLWHHPAPAPVVPGRLDPANSPYVLHCLDSLVAACRSGAMQALVTAPIQKSAIEEAGIPFTGHTEYLADRLGVARVVMMLVGGGLRVALATTHLPLKDVPQAITRDSLGEVLDILAHDLVTSFHCAHPAIRTGVFCRWHWANRSNPAICPATSAPTFLRCCR